MKNESDSSEIQNQQDEIEPPVETRESFRDANEIEIWRSKYLAGDPVREHFSEEQIIQTFCKTHSQETSLVISNNYKLTKQNELKNLLVRSIKRYSFFVIFAAVLVAFASPDPSSVGVLNILGIGLLFFLIVGGWQEGLGSGNIGTGS